MSEPFLSEIRIVSFAFAPKGWAMCNGQILSIAQNQALFSLLGTFYGGNGETNFALPNLQGASPMHVGNLFTQGSVGGQVNVTLVGPQLPAHTHQAKGVSTVANLQSPAGNTWAASTANPYAAISDGTQMNGAALGPTGGNQPHPNMPPYLVMNFIIALQGIFPSRD
jgi:microcystin-dependent protein